MRRSRVASLSCAIAVAAAAGALSSGQPQPLREPADMTASPRGERVAILLPGAQVMTMEERDGWARVIVEGWIRTGEDDAPSPSPQGTLEDEAEPAPTPRQQEAPPVPLPAQGPSGGSIGGVVFVTEPGGTTIPGSRVAVRLLDGAAGLARELDAHEAECARRRAPLEEKAAKLKDEAGRALRSIPNTTRAFEASDEAKAQRRRTIAEIHRLDEECHAAAGALLERHAVRRAVTDGEGRYVLEPVPAGEFLVQAELAAGGGVYSWRVPVTVAQAGRLTVDLTHANGTRREKPSYR
ncbi:MAG TPA: hypothetical protein VJV23_06720 [Candidatus Polarisedimenticolia bacterium]|nr:hypothetical protein [Candidatus Polarisedimenticolia bacterium]